MTKKDIHIRISSYLWKNALEKLKTGFGINCTKTDSILIIMLLALYKKKDKLRTPDNCYLAIQHPQQLAPSAYQQMTIAVYDGILAMLQEQYPTFTYSQLVETALADYLVLPVSFYTDCISPLYTIVGSKNHTMQVATASAVDAMELSHKYMTLIDGCCATGSLFFGIKTYAWKCVILNDLNPLRTNFLNVIKTEPIKLIKKLIEADLSFIQQPETKNQILSEYKKSIHAYEAKRAEYHKVDCNVDIAYKMFLTQCIDKAMIENADKIIQRLLRFLPAHLRLQNAMITQQDCLTYLRNDDTNKLILLDVPYIGSEHTCSIKGYNYQPFHQKVGNYLQNANFPFLYYCRSTPPKADTSLPRTNAEHVMKMKLANYFYNRGFFFDKIYLKEDTELMISNRHYSENQFQWDDFNINIL